MLVIFIIFDSSLLKCLNLTNREFENITKINITMGIKYLPCAPCATYPQSSPILAFHKTYIDIIIVPYTSIADTIEEILNPNLTFPAVQASYAAVMKSITVNARLQA